MSESIMDLINLVRKRFDLFTKAFVLLFLLCLFADYLYDYYGVNILDFESLLPQIVKVLLKKVEFILYWLIPFVCSIPGILLLILLIAYILEVIVNQLDKKESWNPKTEPMGVETAEYYSVSDVYYIGEGETCFLAINKNVTPNYGALLCVVSNAGAEKEYSLFD